MKELRRLREAAHLSGAELGRRVMLSRAAICRMENGDLNPSIEKLCAIADALGCTTDELLGRKSSIPKESDKKHGA